ncbi:uncharacterized protein LOC131025584 [Salvia miltiorrhiza]|uniref:uncharacterized protein LOC131025584 n=1 Tax=Salvia miltiorrhiza TaxID=226208 RepID=UPI0025AD141D|nr:uncharacterized protein LOC131025584 [Salvia miltiorrhiza]
MGKLERMLSTMVEKVAMAGQPPEKPCGACGNPGHTSLQCTGDEEEYQTHANSSHNFYSCDVPLPHLPKRDQYSNNHNAPWRNHPNFRWRDPEPKQPPTMQQPQQQNYRPPHQRTGYQAPQVQQSVPEKQGKSLEEMMADLIGNQQFLQNNVQQLQQSQAEQKMQIEGLARQVSQLATSVNQLKGHQGALPSQVQLNPMENISMITLRSGKELSEPTTQNSKECPSKDSGVKFSLEKFGNSGGKVDSVIQNTEQSGLAKQNSDPTAGEKEQEAEHKLVKGEQSKVHKPLSLHDPEIEIPVPFPRLLAKKKPEEELIDFMKIFGKLEINLPFLQALKIPHLGKFVKDFIADTRVMIQLADGSCVHPEGLLENVLVKDKLEPTLTKRATGLDARGMNNEEVKESIKSLHAHPKLADSGNTFCLPKQDKILHDDPKFTGSGHTVRLPRQKPHYRTLHFNVEPPDLKDKCDEVLRLEAYNTNMGYADLIAIAYHKHRFWRTFEVGEKVRFMLGRQWIGPFEIQSVWPGGPVEIKSLATAKTFVVNYHKLEPYCDASHMTTVEEIPLSPQTRF